MTTETKVLIGVLAATIIIIIGGALLVGRQNKEPAITKVAETERLVREDDAVLGSADAKVAVVEFGDFQCPACAVLHPILKQIKTNNAEQSVRFVYRHFPLPQHENAALAAEASVEAQLQGKFWEYHDVLFENQNQLKREDLERYAQTIGLDSVAFKKALDEHTHKAAVDQDKADGTAINIQGTPSLFINGVLYTGQYSVSGLQAAIDEALKEGNQ